MKLFIVVVVMLFFSACTKQIYNKTYYHIEPDREWELVFTLKSDSTFIIEDKFGCNKFKYSGIWDKLFFPGYECFVLEDTCEWNYDEGRKLFSTQKQGVNYVIADDNNRFEFVKHDTVCYTEANKFIIRGMPFQEQTIFISKNLGKKRARMFRNEFVFKFGKQKFIEVFGEGKNMKKALDNLSKPDCNHR